jgi:hypothetical protein
MLRGCLKWLARQGYFYSKPEQFIGVIYRQAMEALRSLSEKGWGGRRGINY